MIAKKTGINFIFCLLNPGFPAEEPVKAARYQYRQHAYQREGPPGCFQPVDHVHSEDTGDERGEHEDDGHGGHLFHHRSHIIINNVGIGFHGGVQDVGIDVGGFARLVHLDGDVLNQIGVKLIHRQLELQFRKQRLVATDGGDEVRQAVLQSRKPDEVLVVNFLVEVAFRLLNENGDLLESLQVPHRRRKEEAEHQVDRVGKAHVALLLIRYKVNHHVRLEVAHRDADVLVQDDAQRDGGVRRARTYFLNVGYAQDNQYPALVVFITRALVFISDVVQKIGGYVQLVKQEVFIVLRGAGYLCPAIGLPLVGGTQCAIKIPVSSHSYSSKR